ncbi:hypothetical protein CC78DRAFT_520054 [Lojkania enalia]|uniref:Zn(2)-C6 fungal-type domain-containing protein n=1 Tax=Lojkania enalia TaxID=147567 RepID=A0A9P4N2C1_9PLEO|nr:hypothetical protein CC78DRAFT_520054 [Didymosphaeria enalia]
MPPDRNRTSNPQGRQKSCSECAKSKRRCDLRQPSCLRCSRQNLTCIYPPQPSPIGDAPTPPTQISKGNSNTENGLFEFDLPALSTPEEVELLDFDLIAATESVNTLNDILAGESGACEDVSLSRPNYVSVVPAKLFSTSYLSVEARGRIDYCVAQLKLAPSMFLIENGTPWCHPLLYQDNMPRNLQDAHASCALYQVRNDVNSDLIARHIISRLEEAIEAPALVTLSEVLARAHALMLYQIMVVFSGDIRYYGCADILMPRLEQLGYQIHSLLHHEVEPTGCLALYPSDASQTAWKDFIFRESARRTLIIIFHMNAMCKLLAGRHEKCNYSVSFGSRVSFSGPLWNARSAFDFGMAWNDQNRLMVTDLDLTDLLQNAQPTDIDAFGKMLLTSLMGVDNVKGWFYTRGGTF